MNARTWEDFIVVHTHTRGRLEADDHTAPVIAEAPRELTQLCIPVQDDFCDVDDEFMWMLNLAVEAERREHRSFRINEFGVHLIVWSGHCVENALLGRVLSPRYAIEDAKDTRCTHMRLLELRCEPERRHRRHTHVEVHERALAVKAVKEHM